MKTNRKDTTEESRTQIRVQRILVVIYISYYHFIDHGNVCLISTFMYEKSKIVAVPTVCSFGALYFGGWLIDSASRGKCCLHSCNFGFLSSCYQHLKVLRPFCQVVTSHQERLINLKFVSILNHLSE